MRMNISLNDHTEKEMFDENLIKIDLTIDSPEMKPELNDNETIPISNRRKKRGRRMMIHECKICHKQLLGIIRYNFHMKSKHRKSVSARRGAAKRKYRCLVCNKEIRGFTQYSTHLKIIHNKSKMTCSWDGTLLKCPVCKVTLRGYNLCLHLKNQHNTSLDKLGPFSCSSCDRVFARFGNLLHHENIAHESENVIQDAPEIDEDSGQKSQLRCSKCKKSFASDCWLIKHEDKCIGHGRRKLLKCSVCPSVFTREDNRIRHEKRSHPNRIVRKPRIKRHQRKESSDNVKIIYANNLCCSYCPKFFAHVYSKQLHEKLHTGDRPYRCTNCGVSFRLERTFSFHSKKCSDLVDVLWCDGCDYSCKLRSQLMAHYHNQHECDLYAYEIQRAGNINLKSSNADIPVENCVSNFESNNELIPEESEITEEKFSIENKEMVLSEVRLEEDDQWSLIIIDDDED